MIPCLLSFLLSAHAAPMEKLYRAGIEIPAASDPWKKAEILPALEQPDVDIVLGNAKNPSNKRMVMTTFGKTSQICQGEILSLQKNGFKIMTEAKDSWACIIKSEKDGEHRYTAVKEIRRSDGKHPLLLSQVLLIEVGAGKYSDFEKWLATVKVLR